MNSDCYNITYKGVKLDPYRILKEYGITHPAHQHSLKKLLRCGKSHKDLPTDIQECIDTLVRWRQMIEEDTILPEKKWICGRCVLVHKDGNELQETTLLKDGSMNDDGSKAVCFVCAAAQHEYK